MQIWAALTNLWEFMRRYLIQPVTMIYNLEYKYYLYLPSHLIKIFHRELEGYLKLEIEDKISKHM